VELQMVGISPTTVPEEIIDTVIQLAPYAEISHHIPGRIRLKISLTALGQFDAAVISRTIGAVPGVMNQRVNLHARSVVIEYDRKLIPYDLWELLGQIRARPELAPVAGELLRILWH
jgi:hypothetical protein